MCALRCRETTVVGGFECARTCQRFSAASGSPLVLAAAAAPRVVVAFSLPAFASAAVLVTTGAGLANSPTVAPGTAALSAFPCDEPNTPLAFSAPISASISASGSVYDDLRCGERECERTREEMPDYDAATSENDA